jgi:alpha-galactosidase
MGDIVQLRSPLTTTEVVVDVSTGAPTVVWWGTSLGGVPEALGRIIERPVAAGGLDVVAPVSVVPEHAAGFDGRPGLLGRRGGGRDWAPRFTPHTVEATDDSLETTALDVVAGLELTVEMRLDHVLRVRASVRNLGERRYSLDGLTVTLPLPDHASELLAFDGRWGQELQGHRESWARGSRLFENRRGRTSHEHPPLIVAGTSGFGEWSGEVWGAHLAWSGNHSIVAERLGDGRRHLQLGELLHPGEIVLEPGDSYRTPWVLGVHSAEGATPATWGFHRSVRDRRIAPTTPRPVMLNTWEAVYFDHDHATLFDLARRAARVGVERFVLDDGWFGSRRDDTRGLGEWWVSDDVYPDGLAPLIEHVRGLGMDFGIWVEPEMVNPDSTVAREHPDWIAAPRGHAPVLGRNQLVLDLSHPDAFDLVHRRLDALLGDHAIAFVKWDMNRPHVAASDSSGAPATHANVTALYRLIDRLRADHPGVEFESCASGGGRIDHEIVERTERVWTSDCNDALERQSIQRGASMLIPPEVMGCHIGPPRAHTTGRTQSLAFRAATAMFGHLGIEWDLTPLDDDRLDALARVVALHKEHRALLHGGDVVRFDTAPEACAHGVYAPDRTAGIVAYAQLTGATSLTPARLRLPGLDADADYRVRHVMLPGERWGMGRTQPGWLADGVEVRGRHLAAIGVQLPVLLPESAVILTLTAAPG